MHRVVFLFFFLSGFSSLVFEIIWARMLQQVFGTTSFAISTLLTAFMAGLALGSYLGGRLANRVDDQLRLYGLLEGAIGAYALAVPFFLDHLPTLYGLLFEHFLDDFYVFSLLRFAAVFSILLIPTTLMGATLPLVSQWIADRRRLFQGSIGVLYGTNTFGACTGCFLAGFFLLPNLGLSTTNSIFAAVNFALCALVITTARALRNTGEKPVTEELDDRELRDVAGGTPTADPHPPWALTITLVGFGFAGAVAMSYQILWTRAYLITLGSSTYSFTLVLTAVLVGIASGSAAISPWVKKMARPLFWLALAQFAVATTATLSFYLLDRIPIWLFERIRSPIDTAGELYLFQFGLVAAVVFLPSFFQGASFPLVIRAIADRVRQTGGDVGKVYAYNTTGAIVGSFAAGFILMPWLGLQQAIAAVIIINLGIAIVFAGAELILHRRTPAMVALGLAAVMAVGIYGLAPAIDHARLTSGVFRAQMARENFSATTFERYDPEILYYDDGLTATTSVERHGDTVVLKANGKPEASDGADMPTQILVGLLPLLIRSGWHDVDPGDEQVAMIGYGSGVTAGASLQWPLRRLDVVEIEATMFEASHHFSHVNHRPLQDQRLHQIESDGRNFLEYTPQTFDVIISEPSNPWVAGVSSLFTVEFFERARQKLNPDGVYAQWVQLYEMRPDNVRTVVETFHTAFPHVQAYSTRPKGTDLLLLGSERPIAFPAQGYQTGWEIDTVRRELQRGGIHTPYEPYGLLFMNQRQLTSFSEGAPLNTDDNGLLEFSAPRDVLFFGEGEQFFTSWYFDVPDYGDPRPYFEHWPDGSDWSAQAVGDLARAIWMAGKPRLAKQIVDDAGPPVHQTPPADSGTESVDEVIRVLDASRHSLDSVVNAHWLSEDPQFRQRAQRAIEESDSRRQLLEKLYEDHPLEGDGFYGERGLYHALLLTSMGRYRPAERQLDLLADDPVVDTAPVYHFLRATVFEIRRRYRDAYDAYSTYSTLGSP